MLGEQICGWEAETEALFTEAAALAGPRLTLLAHNRSLASIIEPDLQREFRKALEEVAAASPSRPSVSPTLSHGLKEHWPRLGLFDVSLAWTPGPTVFGELKCASDEDTLMACGWDAAKCAFCLRHGVGQAMLLVAAAPAELWRADCLGLELFRDDEWEMVDIRTRYAKGFRKFERDGYWPLKVPSRFSTVFISRCEFEISGREWEIGVARVEPLGEDSLEWKPFLPSP